MANFPSVLDNLTSPTTSNFLDDVGVDHVTQHINANNAINNLETKVGINSSAVTTTLDYLLKNASSIDPGHHHTNATLDGIASSKVTGLPTFPSGTIVGTTDSQTLTSKILTSPSITGPTITGTIAGNPTITKPTLNGSVQGISSYSPGAGGTATLDLSTANTHAITMPAGNITIALSNTSTGQYFIVEITQDGGGSRTVTWFTTIKWAGGTAPTLTTTASKRDTFGFRVTGVGTYDGFIVGQNI